MNLNVLNYINNLLWLGVPDIIKGLAISIVFVLIFKKAIKKYSFIFYIYPGLIFILYCTDGILGLCNIELSDLMGDTLLWELLWLPRSYSLDTSVGLGLIFIVMFIGVLPKWEFVRQLYIIRKEMSVISGFILIGHGVMRLPTMKNAFLNMNDFNIFLGFSYAILGVILLVLILIPWITSFRFARSKLSPEAWKRVQTYTSVPLIILICVFGITVNLGWGFSVLPTLGSSLREIKNTADGTAVSSLYQGYRVSTVFLSAKIYLALTVAYIWLRRKKLKEQSVGFKNDKSDLLKVGYR